MGAFGTVIPVTGLNYGFVGDFTTLYDNEVVSKPVLPTATANIFFGEPVVTLDNGLAGSFQSVANFIAQGGVFTAAMFRGIANRQVHASYAYTSLTVGNYAPVRASFAPNEYAGVGVRGSMLVAVNAGAVVAGQPVYIRTALNAAVPAGAIGGFEGAPIAGDAANVVSIPTLLFKASNKDANGAVDVIMPIRVCY